MKLIVGEEIARKIQPNSFTVEIKVSVGGGHASETLAVGPFREHEDYSALESLLETLRRMSHEGTDRRRGYDTVPGFPGWFGEHMETEEEFLEFYPNCGDFETFQTHAAFAQGIYEASENFPDWPFDVNYDQIGALEEFSVRHFDGDSREFEVTVAFD